MAEKFDPYYEWIGVPPAEQPVDHYRLLGVAQFEQDQRKINQAADARMKFLRTFQAGRHSQDSQQLLNEVSAARVCLLDPKKRAAYDLRLKQRIQATQLPPLKPTPELVPRGEMPKQTPDHLARSIPKDPDEWFTRRPASTSASFKTFARVTVMIGLATVIILTVALILHRLRQPGPEVDPEVSDDPKTPPIPAMATHQQPSGHGSTHRRFDRQKTLSKKVTSRFARPHLGSHRTRHRRAAVTAYKTHFYQMRAKLNARSAIRTKA